MEKACFHSTSGHCLGPDPAQPPTFPSHPSHSSASAATPAHSARSSPSSTLGSQTTNVRPKRPDLVLFHPRLFAAHLSQDLSTVSPLLPTPQSPQVSQHLYLHLGPFRVDTEVCPALPPILVLWSAAPPLWASPTPHLLPGLLLSTSHFQPLFLVRLHLLARAIQ